MRHAFAVRIAEPGKTEEGLNHMQETVTGSDFEVDPNVAIGCIPPVVPDAGLDHSSFTFPQNASLLVAFDCEFAFERPEIFRDSRVEVFAHDTRTGKRLQLGDQAALLVMPGKFQNLAVFTSNGIFPDISELDRPAIG